MKKKLSCIFTYKRVKYVCFVWILLFPTIKVFAQQDTSKKLKEVLISSAKAPYIQTITPSQQVAAADFTRYSAASVADAIRNFAGVNIKDYGGIGGLKTVSVRGLGANHVAVLYDGVQINDAENGQVDLGRLNLNNIQHIALYNGQPPNILQPARSFASASILSITTIKPRLNTDKPYLITAGVKTGSFGLFNTYVQWQQRLSNSWSFIINGYLQKANGRYTYINDDGLAKSKQTRLGSAINAQQVDGALYWTKNDSSKFNFHANYYNSGRGLPGPVIINKPPPAGQRLWNKDLFLQAGYEHVFSHGIHLLVNSKFSQNYLHYFNPQFPSSAGFLDQQFKQHEYYQSAALSYHLLPNWEVSYATDISVNNMSANLPGFRYPTRFALLNVLASTLVLGKTTLQASLLNTDISESVATGTTIPHRNIFSPTIMATIKPFDDQGFQVRGFYKYIFRAPTFNELYYNFITNTKLKPEFTNQYNLGFTYSRNLNGFFQYISLTTDAYYNNVKDKIVYTPNLYNGSVENFGKVDIKGLDAGLKTQAGLGAGYNIVLSANYSHQQAQNLTDPTSSIYLNQLPYVPKNTFAFNIGVTTGPMGVYYNQQQLSSRYYNNNNNDDDRLPKYTVSDAALVYKGACKGLPLVVSAEVNNLFNKGYMVVQSYPMPGRSVRITFQITI
ncbi:TonB-dependent receptor [Mucilaginibacter sp. 14171R-50]|uniref:TonB-dependent receptor n=1 Tax=Mucilaginibacter sp. 14171R-50 TaxID=2703789 RepID=UPI00138D2F79|nr:TonB-dependent receptor [Mucilaginibacter sp. 14171R-50]QHS57262.1 TonB-dependent receptor [Mucilaginibacter sp. 14171R-50]